MSAAKQPDKLGKYALAVRGAFEQPLAIGISGPPGSGKTFSALRLATGLAGDRPIVLIDTENQRALQYAQQFRFFHAELTPPFTPERYLAEILEAEKAGAAVVIVDSASHMHEGEGGILDWHEAEVDRMLGRDKDDWQKRDRVKFAAWIKPKASYTKFLTGFQRAKCHVLFCFRAKERTEMVKVEKNGRKINEPQKVGYRPITTEDLPYALTINLMLPPRSDGRPQLSEEATKIDKLNFGFLQDGAQLTEEQGALLRRWAEGAAPAELMGKPERKPSRSAPSPADPPADPSSPQDWEAGLDPTMRQRVQAILTSLEGVKTGQQFFLLVDKSAACRRELAEGDDASKMAEAMLKERFKAVYDRVTK